MRRRNLLFSSLFTAGLASAVEPALDLAFGSANRASAAIRRREVSSLELTQHCLDRLRRFDSSLHAFVQVYGDWAIDRAKAADADLARKRAWGPLHGLPVSIKECFAYRGTVTSAGIPELKEFRPEATAVLVDRIEKSGAIVLGK